MESSSPSPYLHGSPVLITPSAAGNKNTPYQEPPPIPREMYDFHNLRISANGTVDMQLFNHLTMYITYPPDRNVHPVKHILDVPCFNDKALLTEAVRVAIENYKVAYCRPAEVLMRTGGRDELEKARKIFEAVESEHLVLKWLRVLDVGMVDEDLVEGLKTGFVELVEAREKVYLDQGLGPDGRVPVASAPEEPEEIIEQEQPLMPAEEPSLEQEAALFEEKLEAKDVETDHIVRALPSKDELAVPGAWVGGDAEPTFAIDI